MIVVTIYNENRDELEATLLRIARNVHYLQYGAPSKDIDFCSDEIVIAIMADGRAQLDNSTAAYLSEMGMYDEATVEVAMLGDDSVQMHLFEAQTLTLVREDNADLPRRDPVRYPPWHWCREQGECQRQVLRSEIGRQHTCHLPGTLYQEDRPKSPSARPT